VVIPPVVIPPVVIPPVVIPPVVTPPVVTPPVVIPPVVTPPVVIPPVVTPPVPMVRIRTLSPSRGEVGTRLTIRGSGFGTPGTVRFGTVEAKASSWTNTTIVVRVPVQIADRVSTDTAVSAPIWYRHAQTVLVTVTPAGAAASHAVSFHLDSSNHHGDYGRWLAPRHNVRLGGNFGR